MKRFFILASAAIVALASCAKTEVVYNDAPEQISFKQITGAMTKATHTLNSGNLGVFAHQGTSVYFMNIPFGWNGSSFTAAQYWPYDDGKNGGKLDFTVYYPQIAGADYYNNVLTIPGVTADDAHYYGKKRYLNSTKEANATAVELQHLSAAVVVTADLGDLYTLQSVTLKGATTAGKMEVTYNADGTLKEVATTATNSSADLPCIVTETVEGVPTLVNKTSTTPLYVLPGTQTIFEVVFKQNSGAGTVHTKSIDLSESDWTANYKYTYAIGIASTGAISFTASVEDFSPAADKPLTLE